MRGPYPMSANPYDAEGDKRIGDSFEYKCRAFDAYGLVNDICLCDECTDKSECDMVRNRDWDY